MKILWCLILTLTATSGASAQTQGPSIHAASRKASTSDLAAAEIVSPSGFRVRSGRYADAEYVMVGRGPVPVRANVHNVGDSSLPMTMILKIERFNGSSWIAVNGTGAQITSNVDVNATRQLDFGTFTPQTLQQVGQKDAFYGMNPNITPLYRFRLSTGNDTLVKTLRFYVQRSERQMLLAVKNVQKTMPRDAIGKSNKLNADTLIAAFSGMHFSPVDGVGDEGYDIFERDKWPTQSLNFTPWRVVIWAQGAEPQGLEHTERTALKAFLKSGTLYDSKYLVIAGQDVARIHDVEATSSNGQIADREFVRDYLHAEYRGRIAPMNNSQMLIRGVCVTPRRYETLTSTGAAGDNPPMPATLRLTTGGKSAATHSYPITATTEGDTIAGVAAIATNYGSIYYGFDWRHVGRFASEVNKSGVPRLLLGAFDYLIPFSRKLPMTVVQFDAYQSDRQAVTIAWQTVSEEGIMQCEIERAEVTRSDEGIVEAPCHIVYRSVPVDTSTHGARYRTVDTELTVGHEYNYRLVTVGLDNSRTVEETRLVKVVGPGEQRYLAVVPNVVVSSGTIEYRLLAGDTARVVLYDATGREVRVLTTTASGSGSIALPVTELSSGVYMVRLETVDGVRITEKFTVQK